MNLLPPNFFGYGENRAAAVVAAANTAKAAGVPVVGAGADPSDARGFGAVMEPTATVSMEAAFHMLRREYSDFVLFHMDLQSGSWIGRTCTTPGAANCLCVKAMCGHRYCIQMHPVQ